VSDLREHDQAISRFQVGRYWHVAYGHQRRESLQSFGRCQNRNLAGYG
jgi:hypothetical protein